MYELDFLLKQSILYLIRSRDLEEINTIQVKQIKSNMLRNNDSVHKASKIEKLYQVIKVCMLILTSQLFPMVKKHFF